MLSENNLLDDDACLAQWIILFSEENAMMSHSHLDRYLSILLTTLELGYLKIQMYDFGYMT